MKQYLNRKLVNFNSHHSSHFPYIYCISIKILVAHIILWTEDFAVLYTFSIQIHPFHLYWDFSRIISVPNFINEIKHKFTLLIEPDIPPSNIMLSSLQNEPGTRYEILEPGSNKSLVPGYPTMLFRVPDTAMCQKALGEPLNQSTSSHMEE